MATGLKKNHTILGLHFMGNDGEVDPMGFVKPGKDQIESLKHIYTRIKPNMETGQVLS